MVSASQQSRNKELHERINVLEASLMATRSGEAAAMALVMSYEGHVEKLNAQLQTVQSDYGELDHKYNTETAAYDQRINMMLEHIATIRGAQECRIAHLVAENVRECQRAEALQAEC